MELHPWFHLESIPIYNLLIGIAFVFGILVFQRNAQKKAISEKETDNWVILTGISAIIGFMGGNLWSSLFYPELVGANLFQRLMYAGFSYLPGFITFIVIVFIISKIGKFNTNYLLNETLPSIALTHSIGRVGCALAGCCFGKELESFPYIRFPTREIEILYGIGIFFLFQTRIFENRFLVYLTSYSLLRFFLEFARGDNRGHFLTDFLSPSQEISLILLMISFLYYTYSHLETGKQDKPYKKFHLFPKNICSNKAKLYTWTQFLKDTIHTYRKAEPK